MPMCFIIETHPLQAGAHANKDTSMKKTAALSIAFTALTTSFSLLAHADVDVSLGSKERVTRLFAYPNNCNVICFRNWTLEQTVEHYLTQSVQRDGYASATVSVVDDNDQLHARISGVPDGYDQPLTALLNAGDLAYTGAEKLNVDGKFAYNWYLFLPLGMALENRKSVELLHFPPDYSLTQAQDYLRSATSDRWAELLTDNGIPADQTPAYQTIIDIAPIAAPSNAGNDLEGVYSYFNDYQTTMVKQVSQRPDGTSLPMVAFGAPVRSWLKEQYKVEVPVLGLATISPASGQSVSVIGSNHPSYIWYAADKSNYGGDETKADEAGLKVMGQDLSAACWQAGMGQKSGTDAAALLKQCTTNWQFTNKVETCKLFYTSVRKLQPDAAAAKCRTGSVGRQLDQLRRPLPEMKQAKL